MKLSNPFKKINVAKAVETGKAFSSAHKSDICVYGGIVGMGLSVWSATKAAVVAKEEIEEEKAIHGGELTRVQTFAAAAPSYAKTVALFAGSTFLIVHGHKIDLANIATLAATAKLAEDNLSTYKKKAEEILGVEKAEEIHDEAVKASMPKMTDFDMHSIVNTGKGLDLFQDELTGKWFLSDMEAIKSAINKLNYRVIDEQARYLSKWGEPDRYLWEITVNDYLEEIGLPENSYMGSDHVWNDATGLIEPRFIGGEDESALGGRPYWIVSFYNAPIFNG